LPTQPSSQWYWGLFFHGQSGRDVSLTTHLRPVPRLRIGGPITSLPSAPSCSVHWHLYSFAEIHYSQHGDITCVYRLPKTIFDPLFLHKHMALWCSCGYVLVSMKDLNYSPTCNYISKYKIKLLYVYRYASLNDGNAFW